MTSASDAGPAAPAAVPLRLAELVAALSLGIDLGFGQPMEHVLRQCVIALRLADRLGLADEQRAVVYYTALLVNVGCHSDAHEQAKWFGDDIALKATKYEPNAAKSALRAAQMLGSGHSVFRRLRIGIEFASSGLRDFNSMVTRHAEVAQTLAARLALPSTVQQAVGASYEQWDGKGWPGRLRGAEVPVAARIAQVAEYVEVAHRVGGAANAAAVVRKRAGRQFDPDLAALLGADPDAFVGGLEGATTWDRVIASEPALSVMLVGAQVDAALEAIGDFVDLKTPYLLGHARAVASLAADTARALRLPEAEVTAVRRAGLVHGLGRLGVSNAIWDKAGPLGSGERERVRMQPYLTQRMLAQSKALAPLAALAVQHRERLDGSGYPAGLAGAAIGRPGRVLGAADAYCAMREPRPCREAMPAGVAARELRADVRAGRFDGEVVEALLGAAGHAVGRRPEGPGGLTAREVEVLRLLARGLPSKDIAARLGVAPKTARNHVEHIYAKLGVNSRVTASLFAMEHGLLTDAATLANHA